MKWLFEIVKILRRSREITIKPSFNCNLACEYCLVNKATGKRPVYDEIKAKDWLEIITREKPAVVNFSGGEPLIYRDFAWLVNELIKRKYLVSIWSNLNTLQGLEINKSWRVIFYSTYHRQMDAQKYLRNLKAYREKFYVKVIELETNKIEGSRKKRIEENQIDIKREIYAPDGKKYSSCLEVELNGK